MQWNQIPKIPVTPKRTTAATPRKPATPLRARRIMVPVVDRNGKRLSYASLFIAQSSYDLRVRACIGGRAE
jgi:hypothetical protein